MRKYDENKRNKRNKQQQQKINLNHKETIGIKHHELIHQFIIPFFDDLFRELADSRLEEGWVRL